jgi:general transcription factor 3C polypeptide 5 (transcription factor C subunit 1)
MSRNGSDPTPPSSISLLVPKNNGQRSSEFMVLFPGYIKDVNKALATFGGEEGLQKQINQHPKRIYLRFRPSDPYAHAVSSNDVRSTSCLVIKLKLLSSAPSGESEVAAEPFARVDRVYSFSSPADFQYVGRDRRAQSQRVEHSAPQTFVVDPSTNDVGPEFLDQSPLLCAPHLCAVEDPLEYGFQQYHAGDHGVDITGSKGKRGQNPIPMVPFSINEIPQPLELAHEDESDKGGGSHALGWLQRVFSERPIYIDAALEELHSKTLKASNSDEQYSGSVNLKVHAFKDALNKVCYRFRNGPWKGAWIRRGYDPRVQVEAKQYQVIEYSVPNAWIEIVKSKRERTDNVLPALAETYKDACSFVSIPIAQAIMLQLCDIEDEEVVEATKNPENVLAAVHEATGWLTSSAWEDIRSRVGARYQSLHDAMPRRAPNSGARSQRDPSSTILTGLMEYFTDMLIDSGVHVQEEAVQVEDAGIDIDNLERQ